MKTNAKWTQVPQSIVLKLQKNNQNLTSILNTHVKYMKIIFRNYYFVCLFGFFRPTREFFTHLQTSPLPVMGCKYFGDATITGEEIQIMTYARTYCL